MIEGFATSPPPPPCPELLLEDVQARVIQGLEDPPPLRRPLKQRAPVRDVCRGPRRGGGAGGGGLGRGELGKTGLKTMERCKK